MHKHPILFLLLLLLGAGQMQAQTAQAQTVKLPESGPWNHKKCAVVLTYDDAVDIDLDHVAPALDSLNLKATFYIIGSSPAVNRRLNEWRQIAAHGHELGNHSLNHACDGRPAGRSFVTAENDLSKYSIAREVNEIRLNNVLLKAIDGRDQRTFAYPCGDTRIGDSLFYKNLTGDFVAARGVRSSLLPLEKVNLEEVDSYMINGQTGQQLIDLVKRAMESNRLLVFLFHGVGGGHTINVSLEAHSQLLHFLKQHEQDIWVAPMVELATYIKDRQQANGTAKAN